MKFILLLSLFISSFVEAKSVCTYVYNCAHCVVEVSSDPPIKIQTTDIACTDRLKADQAFFYDVPRNRSDLDKSPLSMPQSPYSGLAVSILAQSIKRSYEDHEQRQQIESFYEDLPNILEWRHQELKQQLEAEESSRNEKKPFDLAAIDAEISKLNRNIENGSITPSDLQSSIPEPSLVQNLGLKEQLKDIEDQIKNENLHGGFPNLSGKTLPDNGGRERRKNNNIQNQNDRKLHASMLDYADNFRTSLSIDKARELENEAKDLRHGNFKEEGSLTNRVQTFELSQAYLEDKRQALNEKIDAEESPQTKNKLESIHQISGTLGAQGRSSFYDGDLAEGEHWTDLATQIVDIGLGFVPVISTGKDLLEAITGKNYVTGEKLEIWERGLCAMSAATLGVGSIAKNSVKIIDAVSTTLVNSNKLGATEVLAKKLIQEEIGLFRSFKDKVWKSANDLNEEFRLANGYTPDTFIEPWVKGKRVLEYTSTKEITLYRVFSKKIKNGDEANHIGKWLMKIDPTSMSKDRIRKLYNITPKDISTGEYYNDMGKYVKVTIPAGTRMRIGIVGHGKDGNMGGAMQFHIIDTIYDDWVSKGFDL